MKIISYALFGNDKFYHKGLERNINIAKKLFKGWRVRVYCCEELKNKAFIKKLLTRKNVDLIFKKQTLCLRAIALENFANGGRS